MPKEGVFIHPLRGALHTLLSSAEMRIFMEKTHETPCLRCKDEQQVIERLKGSPGLLRSFNRLNRDWRQRFLDYCTGRKTLPVTYDPFFKRIFHPDIHPDRLSRLISSLLDIRARVVKVLPHEETLLDGCSLLILDILAQLEDGALVNVEIQKIPYLFPAERMSCYSSDLVLRQYSRVKGEQGQYFKYGDLKKVYTIVIFEKSTKAFHRQGMRCVHRGSTVFDTGLELELLQEYCLVALDVFRKKTYPKDKSEQTAWISFLATDDAEEAGKLAEKFPWLEEIYREMADYLHKPEEVLNMFSRALQIMDENTVKYMIEIQQQELDETRGKLDETRGQLDETRGQLDETRGQLDETRGQLDETRGQLDEAQEDLNAMTKAYIRLCLSQGLTAEETIIKLQEECGLTQQNAETAVSMFSFSE